MRSRVVHFMGLGAALCIFGLVEVHAQTPTAQISGQITDSTGAMVPQAIISITNVDTGVRFTSLTNRTGDYVFPLLVPGTYTGTLNLQAIVQ